ncbi:(d)CMP kinase [Streptomonospora nanhaiensis]|uniref:Cytidylate kinase n=1 Tax=Streptomonospora nanhaiensis TaxID=1323731 RepID=A0A853BJ25_9ACTN|nr:(d)CMP kinase [Streptomonospora nanhaiensis]MBV2365263.1 (d)CMP kinase [Streptomonospora nanhaiensis]MBX9390306.1 (d)CMP kinase [Streptomonospora nanhaiensis]NYI94735.1 cytidylate kinase [Streptomonospora nanhaiensis]
MSAQGSAGGVVVAIDGPSGSGKSSTAKGVASARDLWYLDTGAMYRAVTWWMLRNEVDTADPAAVAASAAHPVITMGTDPAAPTVQVDGRDVAREIRTPEVTTHVSAVSAVPEVRERLVALQRDIIARARRQAGGIVVEGRDITTVVAPDAPVKIYLTASAEARAHRRSREVSADAAATQADLLRRDRLDSSRAASPLTRTEDAIELETTGLSLDEVIAIVVKLTDEAVAGTGSSAAV